MISDNVVTTAVGAASERRVHHASHPTRRVPAPSRRGARRPAAVVRRLAPRRLQPRQRLRHAAASGGGGRPIGVTLITKDSTNPFFVAMQKGAKADAAKNNVNLTVASGKAGGRRPGPDHGDRGRHRPRRQGHPDHPDGTGVNAAIKKARDAGLYVIALDTPPDPAEHRRHHLRHRQLQGRQARSASGPQAQLDGKPATIALLDLFNDKIVSVDYNRDQGFLDRHGHRRQRPEEERRRGQDRQVHRRQGRRLHDRLQRGRPRAPRTAAAPPWRQCLAKNPDINVVYTINEPAAVGANAALKAAGKTAHRSSRSTAAAPASRSVKDGVIGATAQQYPLKMADAGHRGHRQDRHAAARSRRPRRASTSSTPVSRW